MSHPGIQAGIHDQVVAHPLAYACIVVGVVFWLIAYVLAIIQGFRFKTYGIPLVAICCNVAWEAVSCFIRPPPIFLWHCGSYLWFGLDLIIVYQVFRYGRAQQVIPEIKRFFYPIVIGTLVFAFAGQDLLSAYIHDPYAYLCSYLINLTMSVLFFFMYFARREVFPYASGDLAYGIAWTKMIGTGIISIALYTYWPIFYPLKQDDRFVVILLGAVFGIDALYVALMRKARKTGPHAAQVTASAASATPLPPPL